MANNTVTQTQYIETVTQAASQLASGWSEAATRYASWIATAQAVRVISETEKYNKFASELGTAFQQATHNAEVWADAARSAGNTGTANIMQKYATSFGDTAAVLSNATGGARAALSGIALEAKSMMQQAGDMFGGNFGRYLGPAFDASAMMVGALEWATTGNSDKFGGACMGIVLSAGFGIIAGGLLTVAGVPLMVVAIGAGVGALLGSGIGDSMYAAFRDSPIVANIVNTLFGQARNWTAPRDPLVLDLDGDGIETLAINPAAPILFDMDADGVKTGTGWIKPDDALVVLDRNGNGLIDSGSELFGDSTVLQNGPKAGQKAANGFEALADLDANADGVINNLDAAYASLRLWQDANQDGVSRATELKTLGEMGIARIKVTGTTSSINLGNGNTQPFSGSFTRTDGSTGASGVAEVTGSLLLASNGFYREFTDDLQITPQAQSLPQMQGSGLVRDLRHAKDDGYVLKAQRKSAHKHAPSVEKYLVVSNFEMAWSV